MKRSADTADDTADDTIGPLGAQLQALALDLYWSWNHAADDLWHSLDAALWSQTRNAWVVLQTVSRRRLMQIARDANLRERVSGLLACRERELCAPAWFQRAHPDSALGSVAYFSLEFMLSEALPIYSGGLGNVAGDHMKTASDLGVPLVGVGLLYQQGYFRQIIDADGEQHALYPYNDPTQLPISPMRGRDGEWLRLEIPLPGRPLWLRTWQVKVGRTQLYLLDSNDPANGPAQRGFTSELYGGGRELRLAQEIILGIGGWRLLERLGLDVTVCHLNEGHAAFTVLERARCFMAAHDCDFAQALAVTRAGNLFTTHTPVAAGFDRYDPGLLLRQLGPYAREHLRIDDRQLLALGRHDPADDREAFDMALLALRGCTRVNGVSRLHGEVSREIFQPLFPRWPRAEVPIDYVTNGVHVPSWDSAAADELWTAHCGRDRWRGTLECVGADIARASDVELWRMRGEARMELVRYARERLRQQLAAQACPPCELDEAGEVLEADVMTLGFARRFAPYKRPNLLLHDPDRLARLLADTRRPVQLIIAGKAHPDDRAGQAMVTEWIHFIRSRPAMRARVVFLDDYDMLLSERLVQGVDVWINTPRRRCEASGTSGMKVLVNGGLNLSVRDGWWAEAYAPEVGWALGGNAPASDADDAAELYRLLESEIVPLFHARDAEGMPREWLQRVRASMSCLTPVYSANRSLREYTERHYLPASAAVRARAADGGALGLALSTWRSRLDRHWHKLHFGRYDVAADGDRHRFELHVYLDGLLVDDVQVQLYADGADGGALPMTRAGALPGTANGHLYWTELVSARPSGDYTPRVIPWHPDAMVPLEASHVRWREES